MVLQKRYKNVTDRNVFPHKLPDSLDAANKSGKNCRMNNKFGWHFILINFIWAVSVVVIGVTWASHQSADEKAARATVTQLVSELMSCQDQLFKEKQARIMNDLQSNKN